MIVECENCSTRFKLDESRVPVEGIRVRCSHCKETFFLPHPSAGDDETANAIAEQAAAHDRSPSPGTTQDLTNSQSIGSSDKLDLDSDSDSDSGIDEDWEFSDDVPGLDDDEVTRKVEALPSAGGRGQERIALASDDADSGGKTIVDPPRGASMGVAEAATETDDDDGATDEPVFGSVEDFSSLIEDVEEAADEPAFGSVEDFSSLIGDDPPADAGSGSTVGRIGKAGEAESARAATDDADEWDFFEAGEKAVGTPAAALASDAEPDEVGAGDVATRAEPGDYSSDALSSFAAPVSLAADAKALRAARLVGHALGWAATVSLVALGLWQGLPVSSAASEGATLHTAGGVLRVDGVEATWLTGMSGPLLVVRGQLHNPTGGPSHTGTRVRVSLLDASGAALRDTTALAGRPLPAAQIQRVSAAQLAMARATAIAELSRLKLRAGDSIEFQAVFAAVPDTAARFAVGVEAAKAAGERVVSPPPARTARGTASQLEGAARSLRTIPTSRR